MKKLFMFLFLGLFLISFASADLTDLNNGYDYNPETQEVMIQNLWGWGDDLAYLKLIWGDSQVGVGVDNHVGSFNITLLDENYTSNNLFSDLGLTNLRNGNLMSRGKQYKVLTYKTDDKYYTVCSNGIYDCYKVENGTHQVEEWIPLTNPNFNMDIGTEYTVGVFIDTEEGDYGDWVPSLMGVSINEWATWNASFETDLEAWYQLDEASGTIFDSSDNNFDSVSETGITYGQTGIIREAIGFDGTDDNVDMGAVMNTGVSAWTMSAWIKTSDTGNYKQIVGRSTAAATDTWMIRVKDTNKIQCEFRDTTLTDLAESTLTVTNGTWIHVGCTRPTSGGNVKIYVNGVENNLAPVTNNNYDVQSTANFKIGETGGSNVHDFDGDIDLIGVWSRELSSGEMSALYNEGNAITFPTGENPSVTLTAPADEANTTSSTQEFTFIATDSVNLDNVTLYLDGSANVTNTSGFNGSYVMTVYDLSEGVHTWSVLAINNNSLTNQSENRTFNYTQPPIFIDLLSPTDASTSQIALVNVSCRAYIDEGVTQLNLTIDGVTNYTMTNSTPGENLTIERVMNFTEGNYTWGCSALNPSTSAVSANRTFEVLYSSPVINLNNPSNDSTILIPDVLFLFNVTDLNGVDNISLYIDGILNETNTSGVSGNYSFNRTLEDGNYNWSVIANSILGKSTTSQTNIFLVHTTAPTVTIINPTGTVDYFLLGGNETLTYNITEEGENASEHFNNCWYDYFAEDNFLSNSSYAGFDYWNIINGTMSASVSPNSLLIDSLSGNTILSTSTGLTMSEFTEDIPVCINESYDTASTVTSDTTGYYACVRNDYNFTYIIKQNNFNDLSTNFTSYNLSTELNCSGNTTSFKYVEDLNFITIHANDTFGFIASNSSSWIYRIVEVNQTFDNETTEGNIESMSATISKLPSLSITAVTVNYNGTTFIGSSSDVGNYTILDISTVQIPGVENTINATFFWSIFLSDGSVVNLSTQTQLINSLDIDDCSVFTNKILEFTLIEEELQTQFANGVSEVAVNIYSSDKSTLVLNISDSYTTNPIPICLSENLSAGSEYSLDSIVRYTGGNTSEYVYKYYNIVDSSITNNTGTSEINLYSLNASDSTDFQLTFKGDDYLPVEDALIFVERQYISDNTFRTVELPKTDSNGQTVLHLVRNDIIYNIRVVKDDTILASFSNIIAFCQDFTIGDCQINLNAISNESGVLNYDEQAGITFTGPPIYNEDTNIISFTYASTDGTSKVVTMNVERRDAFGNRSICNSTVISPSGTTSCNIGSDIPETTLFTTVSVDSIETITSSVAIDDSGYGSEGYAFFFLFFLAMILMFGDSRNGLLFAIGIGYIGGISLGVATGGLIGIGSSGIWVIVITLIGIWRNNKNKRL